MMSPTTISQTDTLKVAPYLPLITVTFSSIIFDYNQIYYLSLIQSATAVISMIINPKIIMLIPYINPFTLLLSITPPIEDKRAVPNTIHQTGSFDVYFKDSMMLAGFYRGFIFYPNLNIKIDDFRNNLLFFSSCEIFFISNYSTLYQDIN